MSGAELKRRCYRSGSTVVLALCALLTGCGDDTPRPEVGSAPEERLIDESAGTFRGVGLGDSPAEISAALGRLRHGQARYPIAGIPEGTRFSENPKFPSVRRPGKGLRPQKVIWRAGKGGYFQLAGGGVIDVGIYLDGAATNRGVAIGDSIEEAETAYPELRCGTAFAGSDGDDEYPACAGRLAGGHSLWFGGDPINAIEFNQYRFGDAPR